MEFKIDTKPNYTVITPESGVMDVNLAEVIRQKVEESFGTGSHNFVIDLQNISSMDMSAGNSLQDLHHYVYEQGGSLVFTTLEDCVTQTMKKGQFHLSLNLTPTIIEAVDIISMEVLERDLLNES
jgi:anti-anti-sigma factor